MLTATQDSVRARLTEQANRFARNGRLTAARSLLAAIRKQHGDTAETGEIDARICLGENRTDAARDALDRAIACAPDNAGLHLLRADVSARLGDFRLAARDAAEAVILDPADAGAKAMLGIVLLETGADADALACLREAVRDAPLAAAHWQGLAEALRRCGNEAEADAALDTAIARIPGHLGLRTAAMMQAMRRRDFTRAASLGHAARAAGIADACVFGLHGHALSHLGDHAAAADAYQEALKLAPEDVYVRHLVRSAGLLPGSTQAPEAYLEAVFDGYADRFEDHLIGLGYRVPGLIRAALCPTAPPPLGDVLDLGCGTGLIGVVLAGLPMTALAGVDVSAKMLDQAAGKSVYTELAKADIGAFLAADPRHWDTVIAGDVFCYFGALDEIFAQVHRRLRRGGRFVLSVEAAATGTADWRLASQGRFQHTRDYLARAAIAAGFDILSLADETLRHEADAPVAGYLAVLRPNV